MIQNLDEKHIYPTSGLIQTFYKVNEKYKVKSLLVYDGFEEKLLKMLRIILPGYSENDPFMKNHQLCNNY